MLLLCAIGLATIAGFFGRSHWRLELLGHFRVQYFWLLAMAAVVLLTARRKLAATIATALAVANLFLIAPLYLGRITWVARRLGSSCCR
jgi:hypothetical protein